VETPTPDRILEDHALAERARKGEKAAFELLIRRHARLVWATVAGMVRDGSWIEDLVQETFLRGWKSIGQLSDPAAFRPWLLSIARRLVLRHGELQGRSFELEPRIAEEDGHVDREETREQVQAAIARLPERYRLPVTLRYLHEMDYAGITAELGLSNGALRGLLTRGVQKLKRELAPYWRNNR
jgi:RNA polymerase sigma-70 factor (ECF subfamily)